jgi:hypothetical protein
MSSVSVIGLGNRVLPARQGQRRQLHRALAALALPAFFVIGFALCYTSATWRSPPRPGAPPPGGHREIYYPQVRNARSRSSPSPPDLDAGKTK